MSVVETALRAVDWSEKQILVACSGGVDSMVLLHGLLAIGEKPAVLHVNYQLRGEESDQDQELVEVTAKRFGLECHSYTCSPERLKAPGVNLQAAARDFRRELFNEWTARSPQHVVGLAHHADDQLETFFLQLLRGSGTFGLGGMHPQRGQLVRPLLDLPKSELIAYAHSHNIYWREDSSNATVSYRRNVFRNELIPLLVAENPQLPESMLYLMRHFREHQQEVIASVETLVTAWNNADLNVNEWQQLSEEQKLAFVHKTALSVWTIARFDQLAAGETGSQFAIGDRVAWKTTADTIRLYEKELGLNWDYKIEEVGILPAVFDKETLYLDAEKIDGRLQFRSWHVGDRIKSIGLEGSQLVSDVLKDAGIPLAERQKIPILADDREVLWIPGIKVGRTAIAVPETVKILRVSVLLRD